MSGGRFHQLRRDREPRGLPRDRCEAGRDRLAPRPAAPTPPRHPHLGRRPPGRAARHVRGTRRRRSSPTRAPRVDDRGRRRAPSTGSTTGSSTTRSGSTRSSASRCSSARSSPTRFDEMRRGAYDIHARVHDMDLNGVYASLCFPSSLAGFAGQRYQLGVSDPELARAVVRAANDWQLEEWAGTYPGRIIPLQLPWLLDPEEGAAEIRAQRRARLPRGHVPRAAGAARASRRCTPATGTRSSPRARRPRPWCACTSGRRRRRRPRRRGAPSDTIGVLFFGWAMFAAVDWLYSKVPRALPRPEASACRRAASAGSRACSTGSTTSVATRRSSARGTASSSRRAR